MTTKTALITGATSGIGRATAKIFAKNGYNLIITGRRKERLFDFAKELNTSYGRNILPLCFDVRDKNAVESNLNSLDEERKDIDVLVNNAGLALGLTTVDKGDPVDWDTMIDTNIKGLLYMTKFVSKMMIARGKGHIINIGSIAGKEVYPNGNVYCATKHAED
jgi:NADP-dependent 3-hydroxy acid dehydrogenase YdfG